MSNEPTKHRAVDSLAVSCQTDLEHLRSLLEHQLQHVTRSLAALSALRAQISSGDCNFAEVAQGITNVREHLVHKYAAAAAGKPAS